MYKSSQGAHRGYCGRLVGVVMSVAILGGCPDPEGKLDAFLEETRDVRDLPPPKEDLGSMIEDVSGTFLMVVASSIAKDKPLQFLATQTFTPTADGGLLDLTLQPLSLDSSSTTSPRLPVGDPIALEGIKVDAEGRYAVPEAEDEFITVMVTGMANPITGSDIVTELRYAGFIQSADFICGNITGAVLVPLDYDLMGSTFAAIRVEDTSPASLPVPFVDFEPSCE